MPNLYFTSTGERISEATIRHRYSVSIREKHVGYSSFTCQACLKAQAVHNDHTISRARCKELHKAELIYNPGNFEDSCANCHSEWETFKSGKWMDHKNVEKRLLFMKKHDPDGYNRRMEFTELALG